MAIPHRSGRRPQAPADRDRAGLEVLLRRAARTLGYGPSDFDIRRPAADSARDRILELHAHELLLAAVRRPRGRPPVLARRRASRSEETTAELQSLMRVAYAVFSLRRQHH